MTEKRVKVQKIDMPSAEAKRASVDEKEIEIPVTRIEGHGKVTIVLSKHGHVVNARFNVVQLRAFEKFVEGMPVEEVPRVVSRICGV